LHVSTGAHLQEIFSGGVKTDACCGKNTHQPRVRQAAGYIFFTKIKSAQLG
jgi:hypothetical protein